VRKGRGDEIPRDTIRRQIENLRERLDPHCDKFGDSESRDGVGFWSSQPAGQQRKIARVLRPPDLPIQQPTKYELVLNLKTAKSLGLTVSDKLLAGADQVLE
jgi:hypothetical protein